MKLLEQKEVYISSKGETIKISELETERLKNIIKMLTTDINKTINFIDSNCDVNVGKNPFKQIRKSKLFKALQLELLKRVTVDILRGNL